MTEWSDRFERWLEEHFPAAQDLDDIAERYQTWRATLPPGDQLARTIAYCERLYLDGTDGIPYADFAKSARAEQAAKAAGRETPAVLGNGRLVLRQAGSHRFPPRQDQPPRTLGIESSMDL